MALNKALKAACERRETCRNSSICAAVDQHLLTRAALSRIPVSLCGSFGQYPASRMARTISPGRWSALAGLGYVYNGGVPGRLREL